MDIKENQNLLSFRITGADNRLIAIDLHSPESTKPVPIVVFAHGFKGFKDWGCWHLIAEAFAKKGFAFLKFNFSHNGTTPESLHDFADLEAFGQNTYSKEWTDLDCVMNWVTENAPSLGFDITQLSLIGHSRGGGIAIAKAVNDRRIKKLVTWAAVRSLAWLWASETVKKQWENEGVLYQMNARTRQNMPLYYTLCSDYEAHQALFDLDIVAPQVAQPWLIVHGTADTSVLPSAAKHLYQLQPKAELHLIDDADHTFGGKHPWESDEMPPLSIKLVNATIDFLKT